MAHRNPSARQRPRWSIVIFTAVLAALVAMSGQAAVRIILVEYFTNLF
jgi:hypothetical protein